MAAAAVQMVRMVSRYRGLLLATTGIEMRKRYAGSFLGGLWVVLNPLLFLGVYLFLYLVVFKVRFPDMGELSYTAYVFTGLVPFLGFMEAVTVSAVSIKQNMHLVKNVILPIDLVPVRVVMMALVSEIVGLAMTFALLGLDHGLDWHMLWVIPAVLVQMVFLLGLAWLFAALGVILPDLGTALGLVMLFVLFVSPIAFKPDMVPERLRVILAVNPAHYMLETFRAALLPSYPFHPAHIAAFVALALGSFFLGAGFFRRFKGYILDYE